MVEPRASTDDDDVKERGAFADGREHLDAELRWLAKLIRIHGARLRQQCKMSAESFLGMHVPESVLGAAARPRDPTPDPWALRRGIDRRVEWSRVHLPLQEAAERVGLDQLQSAIMVLVLAHHEDLRFEQAFAYLNNDTNLRFPTLELALTLFGGGERTNVRRAIVSSRLVREGWVRLVVPAGRPTASILARELRACDELVHFVLGYPSSTESPRAAELTPDVVSEALAERIRGAARRAGEEGMVVLRGREGLGRRAVARAVAAELDRSVLVVDGSRAPEDDDGRGEWLLSVGRAARLGGACPVVWRAEALLGRRGDEDPVQLLAPLREMRTGPIFLALDGRHVVPGAHDIELTTPGIDDRFALWRGGVPDANESDLRDVAAFFHMTPLQIARALAKIPSEPSREDVFRTARSECGRGLEKLASRVRGRPTMDDLVLPSHVATQLRELLGACRHRHRVLHRWGFEQRLAYGLGTYALFAGGSGNGKTLAASVIATALGLELYRVDIASVVSKYIGETEQNLDRVFSEAEAASAMLLFDECDAMFGSRSEVSDARDRYANLEVAFLLQRMESHRGVVVLTTNLRKNIDDAFVRRIGHIIEFPFPDAALRERLFHALRPPEAPLDPGVDLRSFAKAFELSGGNIRNVLMAAAFLAAEDDSAITTEHLLRATSRELQKMGKLSDKAMLSRTDLR